MGPKSTLRLMRTLGPSHASLAQSSWSLLVMALVIGQLLGRIASQEIAVMRLAKSLEQGAEQFKNEVMLMVKLQHCNLVNFLVVLFTKKKGS